MVSCQNATAINIQQSGRSFYERLQNHEFITYETGPRLKNIKYTVASQFKKLVDVSTLI